MNKKPPITKQNSKIIDLSNTSSDSSNEADIFFQEIKHSQKQKKQNPDFFSESDDPKEMPNLCKICFQSIVSIVFFPCRHACVCNECFFKLPVPKRCPICQTYVNRNIEFILCC